MKRILFLILSVIVISGTYAQDRKKVGVVLSGGGAKGVAHVGALKVIEEAGIPIDVVVGTSMGSIVGGLYSIGYSPSLLDSMIRHQDWSFTLTDRVRRQQKTFLEKVEAEKYILTIPFQGSPSERNPLKRDGFVKGLNLQSLFCDLTVGYHDSIDFAKLPIPFACVAVDLIEGKEYVFHDGYLSEAMRASMAIPAVFTPVRKDSMVLIDGGLLNNYPVDVAKALGADIIIGVDVQSGPETKSLLNDLMDVMNKITDMTGKEKYLNNIANTDVYIKVDVKGYNSASFEPIALDTLIHRGEVATRNKWEELIAVRKLANISDDYEVKYLNPYDFLSAHNPLFVREITFNGLNSNDRQRVMEKSGVIENSHMTTIQVKKLIDNIYALQNYTNVNYNFNKNNDDSYNVVFSVEEIKPHFINLGVRFDSEEIAAVQLGATYQFETKMPTRIGVTGRLGKRTGLRVDYLLLPSRLRCINLSYSYQYNDLNIYYKGDREFSTTYSYHLGELGYTNILNRNTKIGFGLRYEYFDYNSFLFNKTENITKVTPEGFFTYYAIFQFETKDKKSFPNRGTSLKAEVNIHTDNLSTYDGHTPFGSASIWWETAFSPTRRFSIIPGFFGRVLFGQASPYPYMNMLGGEQPGRYMVHQLPFVGIGYMEVFEDAVLIGRVEARQRMGKKNYMSFIANYGMADNSLDEILKGRNLFGFGIGYGYDSFVGPIELSFHFSNRTKSVGFYANVGFLF